jgi:signal transduction histidine kinase
MLNAADAMKEVGVINITTAFNKKQDHCVISVEDSGPGIPDDLKSRVFEPFFSTKGTNGLGLAVTWGIVERHRGTIEVDDVAGGGAIFRVVIPARGKTHKPSGQPAD